jgi:hypothetical protein
MPRVASKTSGLHRPAWPRPVSVIKKSIGQTLRDVLFISAQPSPARRLTFCTASSTVAGSAAIVPRACQSRGGATQPSPARTIASSLHLPHDIAQLPSIPTAGENFIPLPRQPARPRESRKSLSLPALRTDSRTVRRAELCAWIPIRDFAPSL